MATIRRHTDVASVVRLATTDRLSIPRPGKTVLSSVRSWGSPFYSAFLSLRRVLQQCVSSKESETFYSKHFYYLNGRNHSKITSSDAASLCASAIIWNWIIAQLTNSLASSATLSDADQWASGVSRNRSLLDYIPKTIQSEIIEGLSKLNCDVRLLDVLPYITEVFETEGEILTQLGSGRKRKRLSGVFYTPSDVADYIVNSVAAWSESDSGISEKEQWLDPACGSGIFLLAALRRKCEQEKYERPIDRFRFAERSLFGIDISESALQSTAYNIIANCFFQYPLNPGHLAELLLRFRQNLARTDATKLLGELKLGDILPPLSTGVDFVVSNPPYSKKDEQSSDFQMQMRGFVSAEPRVITTSGNIYIDFVKLMPRVLRTRNATGGMVVPMSIAYSSRRNSRELRHFIDRTHLKWSFAHFDRTPDSLFGDDVKTRNSIAFVGGAHAGDTEIFSTDFLRWSSRQRSDLFSKVTFCYVGSSCVEIIPKIGDNLGLRIYQCLQKNGERMSHILRPLELRSSTRDTHLLIQSTAYNWIPVELVDYDTRPRSTGESAASKIWLTTGNNIGPATVFSVLNSRLVYWLWRVRSDGFHVTDSFVSSIPISLENMSARKLRGLHDLGIELWGKMKSEPIVSKNSGKVSTTFCPLKFSAEVTMIDELLMDHLDLPKEASKYLRNHAWQTVVAGRDAELGTNPALTNARELGIVS